MGKGGRRKKNGRGRKPNRGANGEVVWGGEIKGLPGTKLCSWGRRQKTGSNSKNINERSGSSGGLGLAPPLAGIFRYLTRIIAFFPLLRILVPG